MPSVSVRLCRLSHFFAKKGGCHLFLVACAIGGVWAAVPDTLDAAFARFWAARNPSEAARAAPAIERSGASFDEVYARLKRGRPYSKDVPTGIVTGRRGAFAYTIDVPATYDPSRQYQVRIHLHGGVMRDETTPRPRGIGRLAGVDQIYVIPVGWSDAPWWSSAQLENLRAILDTVKRTYNVDENHVVVSGVSDGGTGAYFVAMRDTTPYASFLPLNGFALVLQNDALNVQGDLFPTNLRNKPLFVVNGGRDPLYPASGIEPYLDHLLHGGVSLTYKPQPQAGHDTSWWPSIEDQFESFVRDHPRQPFPNRLTWETSDTRVSGRAHWVVIDALDSRPGDARDLPDLNDYQPPAVIELGFRLGQGLRINRIIGGSMADRVGLRTGDVIQKVGDTVITSTEVLVGALQGYKRIAARTDTPDTIRFTIERNDRVMELSGAFDPEEIRQPRTPVFKHHGRSGRIDLVRNGNTIEAVTRGVSEFTLLLSPDQVDFGQPLRVLVNGRVAFEGRVEPSLATLLAWAARDNDRTMLIGAELKIKL